MSNALLHEVLPMEALHRLDRQANASSPNPRAAAVRETIGVSNTALESAEALLR